MLAKVIRNPAAWSGVALKTALLIGVCFSIACIVWFVDRRVLRVELTAYIFSYGFFANALPFVLLFLLVLVLSNRIALALLISSLAIMAIYFADHQKIKFLAAPLSFNDFFLLRDVDASTVHLLANYVNSGYLLIAALALIAAFVASIVYEIAFFAKKSFMRGLLGAAVLFLSFTLIAGTSLAWRLYNPARLRVIPWSPMKTILHTGLLGSIEYARLDFYRAVEVPVDKDAIRAFTAMPQPFTETNRNPGTTSPTDTRRPDIIMIQSLDYRHSP